MCVWVCAWVRVCVGVWCVIGRCNRLVNWRDGFVQNLGVRICVVGVVMLECFSG